MSFSKIHFLLPIIVWGCFGLNPLGAQDMAVRVSYNEQNLNFTNNGNEIFGKLITPNSYEGKLPVIVFVHGSGPEDYSSSDNYQYLWEEFTKIGFACYSWDRPGVGQSQGKWYELSVADRANEVISAVSKLKTLDVIDHSKIGFWGISQAGWVIPQVAEEIEPAFVITVSSPVTTAFEQELYRVKSEMQVEGFSRSDIRKAVSYNKKLKKMIKADKPYERFLALQKETEGAKWANNVIRGEEIVYDYLSIVFKKDNPPDLRSLNCPILAIWGENDLVVPPKKSSEIYKKKLGHIGNRDTLIRIIPKADHTLTFNLTGKRSETIERRELYKDSPKEVFAPGYVSLMTGWLKDLNLEVTCTFLNVKKKSENEIRIGQTTLEFLDNTRSRPLVTEVWYPTTDSLKESDKYFSPFLRKHTARDAKLPNNKHPLILISHGTGGSRLSLEWLTQSLVLKGYIVAAVDHWGNTFDNRVAIEFIKPWERPQDVSVALTKLLEHQEFKKVIDTDKIGSLGFSYGGYTVLALAGAVLDYSVLLEYYKTPNGLAELNEIREFPGISELLKDESFIEMTKKVPPLKDGRIKAFFAISPGTAQGFINKEQFKDVKNPVFIVGCEADMITPVARYARHYHNLIEGSKYYEFSGKTGHYVMLAEAIDKIKEESPIPFVDDPSVDRSQVHQKVIELSIGFFNTNLYDNTN